MSDLDAKEQKHVRTVLRLLRRRVGGWKPLSKALRFEADTLEKVTNGRAIVSASMAFRVARFAGASVEALLEGQYVPPGTCPHCGRAPDFTDEDTVAENEKMSDALKLVK